MFFSIDLFAEGQSQSFHISPEAVETDVAFTVLSRRLKRPLHSMPTCLLANSLNGGRTLSHRHKDRMSDTVTEQKEPFSELNRAILSTEERQMSGERWL